MSLINDALKKAQSQRTGDAPRAEQSPLQPGHPAPAPAPRASHRFPWTMVGAGALGGGLIAVLLVLAFRPSNQPTPHDTPVRETSAATTKPTVVATKPENTPSKESPPAKAPAKEPETKAPVGATAAPASTPIAATATPSSDAIEHSAVPTVETKTMAPAVQEPAPSAPVGPPKPSLKMISAIEALRVVGIRAAGSDSKVIMNDRVFRLGDVVDHSLGLKLVAATANSLTFADPAGATYTRTFY